MKILLLFLLLTSTLSAQELTKTERIIQERQALIVLHRNYSGDSLLMEYVQFIVLDNRYDYLSNNFNVFVGSVPDCYQFILDIEKFQAYEPGTSGKINGLYVSQYRMINVGRKVVTTMYDEDNHFYHYFQVKEVQALKTKLYDWMIKEGYLKVNN